MDVDLRKLRYVLAVAEELHFGRAAQRLHIAQPVLSRQIRMFEGELGAELFVRDRRHTELTPAGEQLLHDAKPLLASAAALLRRSRMNTSTPSSLSSTRIWRESTGGVMCRRSAARPKWSSSATARK